MDRSPSSIERALLILEACAKVEGASSVTEIARATRIPKSSVHRLCWRLVELGALTATAAGFTIGVRVLALGTSNPWLRFLRTEAAPVLHTLVATTDLVGNLALLVGQEAVIIDEVFASARTMPKEVGRRLPLHASAVGKALLMNRTSADIERILQSASLKAATTSTVTSREKLWEQVSDANSIGYIVSIGEWKVGRFGVAAPVVSDGRTVASIGLVGLSAVSVPEDLGERVRDAAARLTSRLQGGV